MKTTNSSNESSDATHLGVISGFATSDDGVDLHWRIVGSGPLLVCCNGVGVGTFFWKYFAERFRETHRILLWDYRAHGRSQRILDGDSRNLSIRRHAMDLQCILDHLEEEDPVVLVGHSMGCQVALESIRIAPNRVRGLVLALGTAGRALHTFYDFEYSWVFFRAVKELVTRTRELTHQVLRPLLLSPIAYDVSRKLKLVDPYYMSKVDLLPYLEHLATLDLPMFLENVVETDRHDCWDILDQLSVPVLVIAAENDKFTPLWCSQKIVDTIPNAELMVLADASHAALVEQPETINYRIAKYLAQLGDSSPFLRSTSTLKRDTVSGKVRPTSDRTILLGTK